VVAGGIARPEVVFRSRAELGDPAGRVRRNVYHAARALELAAAAALVEAAERIAAEQAAVALERTVREAADEGAVVRSCAVVVGAFRRRAARVDPGVTRPRACGGGTALSGCAAAGRRVERARPVAIPKQSIWEQGEAALDVAQDELGHWIDQLRREVGPPWAQDQKLAALAAWIALARSS
jgi:hypothetical protein